MEPTLNISDRILVVKDKFLNIDYEIGDVIVFYNPNYEYNKKLFQEFYDSLQIWNLKQEQLTVDTAFVKRIVGLEGDVIKIDQNGNILNNGINIDIDNLDSNLQTEEIVYVVPDNNIFVIGDNIKNSIDSRVYGSIDLNQVIGKAYYKIYPLNEIEVLND